VQLLVNEQYIDSIMHVATIKVILWILKLFLEIISVSVQSITDIRKEQFYAETRLRASQLLPYCHAFSVAIHTRFQLSQCCKLS